MKNIRGSSTIAFKLFSKFLIVIVILASSQRVNAIIDSDTSQIKVTISSQVLKKIAESNFDVREKMQSTIEAGNKFIPLHFSGQAYDSDPQNEYWENDTEPLIALKRKEWTEQWESSVHIRVGQFDKKVAYFIRLTCPKIVLVSFEQSDESSFLLYRTTSMGLEVNYPGWLFDFTNEGAGRAYDLKIEIDSNNLIKSVTYPDDLVTQTYVGDVSYIKKTLADHTRVGGARKEVQNEIFRTYPLFIKKIEEQAAKICK